MALKKQNSHSIAVKNKNSFTKAFVQGNVKTKLSALVFGLGNILNKQIIHGLLLLAVEVVYIIYMVNTGIQSIVNFITLGTKTKVEVYNEAKQIYEYVMGDNSMLCLLYGVVTIFITLGFLFMLSTSVRSAYASQLRKEKMLHQPTFIEELRTLKHQRLHVTLLSLPTMGIIIFTIVPLVFMILVAFTNYDNTHQAPANLFDWVGLANFKTILTSGSAMSKTFWPVLGWTLIWAVCATASNFMLGIILALLINRKATRAKGFWRFIFVLSIAVPQFVSLLTMRTMLNTNGAFNVILRSLGFSGIPFLTDPAIAKVAVIIVNIWVGVPYTLLISSGILKSIPENMYEAAKLDGANPVKIFFKITMPYMLFVMTPYLITQFAGNINNFNVIYLLTSGGPKTVDYHYAGKTDLLVTWLYSLTVTNSDYNMGAVIGIIVFIILAFVSLVTYRHSVSYKDEETFQ